MSEEERFDELLQSKLSERDFPFNELNWDEAEKQIIRQENRRKRFRFGIIFLCGLFAGMAIMLPFMKQWSVIGGQWSVVSGQLAGGSGQASAGGSARPDEPFGRGQSSVSSGQSLASSQPMNNFTGSSSGLHPTSKNFPADYFTKSSTQKGDSGQLAVVKQSSVKQTSPELANKETDTCKEISNKNQVSILPVSTDTLPLLKSLPSNWDYGLNLGASGFLGSIGGISAHSGGRPLLLDIQPSQVRWDVGFYLRRKISTYLSVSAQLDWVRVQGADSLSQNKSIKDRNLNFRDDIFEGSVRGEWTFYENPDIGGNLNFISSFNAYLFIGAGIFHMNPETMVTHSYGSWQRGEWISLRDLRTGGEPAYNLVQPAIPMGIGFYYTINKQFRIGWNFCWNKTFTHYLDDVSGKYPPLSEWNYFTSQSQYVPNISKSELAEYAPGTIRGGTNYESFVTTSITVGYIIKSKPPKNVQRMFFNKVNYKSRATF